MLSAVLFTANIAKISAHFLGDVMNDFVF